MNTNPTDPCCLTAAELTALLTKTRNDAIEDVARLVGGRSITERRVEAALSGKPMKDCPFYEAIQRLKSTS